MCTSPNFMMIIGEKLNPLPNESRFKWMFIPSGKDYNLIGQRSPRSIVQVPCGQCLECKLEYARQWTDRCSIEAQNSPYNYFITLTYDDKHLREHGLNPRDMTLFIKRLRKKFKNVKCKYLYAGEYGSLSLRPHYHIAVFNLPLDDLTYQFISYESGEPVRTNFDCAKDNMYSPTIHQLWYDESDKSIIGNITVAPFLPERAGYIARYCVGKLDRKLQDWYEITGNHPEFIRMSQGLGKSGYDPNYMLEHDVFVVPSVGVRRIPRYYEKLFRKDFGDLTYEMYKRKDYNRMVRWSTDKAYNIDFNALFHSRNYILKKIHWNKSII